jgi:HK97 family phage prohead protease
MSMEHKFLTFDIKADEATDGVRSFSGYGSVFDTIDSYGDTIVKGAFRQTLKEWKAKSKLPKLLLQHGGGGFFSANADDMVPIGKWDEMKEDDHGLFVRGHLFDLDTDRAKSVYAAMREKELDGLSIGFRTKKWKFDEDTDIRTLTEIELWEVSLVTFPANDPARVSSVKAEDGKLPTERAFEDFLRDAGFSRQQAKAIVADGFEHYLRDAGFTATEARDICSRGYRQVRRDAMPSGEACGELLDLVKQIAAIPTGVRHGTAGSHTRSGQDGSH